MNQARIKLIQKVSPIVLWVLLYWLFFGRYRFDSAWAGLGQSILLMIYGPFALAYAIVLTRMAILRVQGREYIFSKQAVIVTAVTLAAIALVAFLPFTMDTPGFMLICGGLAIASIVVIYKERNQLAK